MKKCIIIGGGPAGLTAGYELLKKSKDYEVIILEQSEVLGGISRTVKYNGHRMDIGGHRFFSKDKNVNKFIPILQDYITFQSKLSNNPDFAYYDLFEDEKISETCR